MSRPKPSEIVVEARRRNMEQLARLGAEVRASRKRRHLSQAELGARVGRSRMTIGRVEAGKGGAVDSDTLQAVAIALDRAVRIVLERDAAEEPADAGHLAIQSLLLRLGHTAGYGRNFELATRPADPARSVDVGWLDDRRRFLVLLEAWNSFGDIGASARSFTRKLAEAEAMAAARWGTQSHRVAGCWVVRATKRNIALVRRYQDVFAAQLPGSSAGWVAALTRGSEPPGEPGLVWCDLAATRMYAWRRHSGRHRR